MSIETKFGYSPPYEQFVIYNSNDNGLTFPPIKADKIVKNLHIHSNLDAKDPHTFKEEIIIQYTTAKAVAGKFPNGTVFIIYDEASSSWQKEILTS